MHYVIGDIHNDLKKLQSILKQVNLTTEDELIVLGDVFDRGGTNADPVGVYFALSGIQGKCTWIRGNHDQWLADYIEEYFSKSETDRRVMAPYSYNTFELMRERLTEVDMLNLASLIHKLPYQKELVIKDKKYLFAHAMTSHPNVPKQGGYYLMGNFLLETFFMEGVDGYISIVGHTPTGNLVWSKNESLYLDDYLKSIWRNEKENVYLMDCGSGFESGRLACMCIETGERFYSDCE